MATPQERKCPDCSCTMHPIRLIDKTHEQAHAELEYTVPEAKRSFWLAQYPVKGRVMACMCDRCGRIILFGASYDEAS